jgi:hypothetical protein
MVSFHWNIRSWSFAFKNIISENNLKFKNKSILEIGATSKSNVGTYFSSNNQIFLSSIDKKEIEKMKKLFSSKDISVIKLDLFNFEKKFDLIIMKSILGGLCRKDGQLKANSIIEKLKSNNLKKGGGIISLDNGKPIYNNLLKNFGSRKNDWFFFKENDLKNFEYSSVFGFLSSFSFKTRIGFLGSVIEDFIYILDRLIFLFYKKNPTIIIKYFKKIE